MSQEYYYNVSTKGADERHLDSILEEVNAYYEVQQFNGEAPGIHWGGQWESIKQDLADVSARFPGVLFLVTEESKDWVDPTPQRYYFANGQAQSAGGDAIFKPVSGRLGVQGLLEDNESELKVSGIIRLSTEHGLLQIRPSLEGDVLTLSFVDENENHIQTRKGSLDWWTVSLFR